MRDTHLRDFLAVVETGSVRAGAKLRGVTPAAISRNLVALERDCGIPLLSRTNHGSELTEAGRILLRRARVVEAELRKAEEEIASLTEVRGTTVVVALSSVAEALLLPTAIDKFMARFPHAKIRVVECAFAEAVHLLREGQCDFVVGTTDVSALADDLQAERLLSSDLIVAARQGHPKTQAESLHELAEYEWIGAGSEAQRLLACAFDIAGLPVPQPRIERGSIHGMVTLLLQSNRLSIASVATINVFYEAGLISILPIDLKLPPVAQYLTVPARRPLTMAADALATEFRRASRGHRR